MRALRFEPEYYQDYTKMNALDHDIDDIHNEIAHLEKKWEELMEEMQFFLFTIIAKCIKICLFEKEKKENEYFTITS